MQPPGVKAWRVEGGQDDLGWLCSSVDWRYLRLEWRRRLGSRLISFFLDTNNTVLYCTKKLFLCMQHRGVKGGRWPGPMVALLKCEERFETGMTKETKEVDWYCSSWIQIMIKYPVYIVLSPATQSLMYRDSAIFYTNPTTQRSWHTPTILDTCVDPG